MSSTTWSKPSDILARKSIRDWMRRELYVSAADYDDCGEINVTLLAENCAIDLGHEEWLDDDLHEVWSIAVEMAEVSDD